MDKGKRHRIAQAGQTGAAEYHNTPPGQTDALGSLFKKMSRGEMPNFLELMAAISDLVAFSVECDSNPTTPPTGPKNMSQKKCRFCD